MEQSDVFINRLLGTMSSCTQLLYAYLMKYIIDEFKVHVEQMIKSRCSASTENYDLSFAEVVIKNSLKQQRWRD